MNSVISKGSRRSLDIDIARAICIILVILGHSHYKSAAISQWIYSFHMPFFFLISGVLYGYKKADGKPSPGFTTNVYNKFRSLLVPYFVFCIIEQAYVIFTHIIGHDFSVSTDIIEDGLLIISGNFGVEWFLACMFLASCVFWVCTRVHKYVGIGICVIAALVGTLVITGNSYLTVLLRAAVALSFMGIGYYTSKYWKKEIHICPWVVLLVIQICLSHLNPADLASRTFNSIPLYYINAVLGTYLIFQLGKYLSKLPEKIMSAFSQFGRYSIVILCTHNLFTEIILLFDYKLFGNSLERLGIVGGVILTIIICIIEIPTIWFCKQFLKPIFNFK